MSFKFRIGQTVKRKDDKTEERFRVIALMLSGYIKVKSLKTRFPQVVKAADFEEAKNPIDFAY